MSRRLGADRSSSARLRMEAKVCSWLAAVFFTCNVAAAITHQIAEEKTSVSLSCPHVVDSKVTWSREKDGGNADILTISGDGEIRHDKDRRYNTVGGKSLYIGRVSVSDAGRYFCNNEAAAELTVIPSGTQRLDAALKSSVRLNCSSDAPTWVRQTGGSNVTVFRQNGGNDGRFRYSVEHQTLTVSDMRLEDAGLYLCDGKPSAYLTVSEEERPQKAPVPPLAVVLPVLLLVAFVLLVLAWRCRRRRSGEQIAEVVYADVTDPTAGESKQRDVTYSVIQSLPQSTTSSARSRPNETLYSSIHQAG